MMSRLSHNILSGLVLLSVAGAILLLHFGAQNDLSFAYSREAISAGNLWSAISGHFWHATFSHFALNLIAWILVWLYAYLVFTFSAWILTLSICIVGVSFAIYQLLPEVAYYSGFSAVLHGVLVAACFSRLRSDRLDFSAIVALLLIIGKLVYEQYTGALPLTEELTQIPVLVDSHLYGAVSGAIAAGFMWLFFPLPYDYDDEVISVRDCEYED